jgi:hypothetical protein
MDRRIEISLTQVCRSICVPTLRYICFSKRTAISRFGLFIFEIIQLETKPRRAGVIACIQALAGKILGVHSHTVVKTPGLVKRREVGLLGSDSGEI